MKVLVCQDGRRLNIAELISWYHGEPGQVVALVKGATDSVSVASGLTPEHAEGLLLLIDEAALSTEAHLVDVPLIVSRLAEGGYIVFDHGYVVLERLGVAHG